VGIAQVSQRRSEIDDPMPTIADHKHYVSRSLLEN
jgi:hypothetical protein